MTAYANVDGETVTEATLHVPNVGPWWAEVTFELAPALEGGAAVVLSLGELELRGTVDPNDNGVFGEQRKSRIIGGGGAWGTLLAAQHYHNDAGVRALAVAQDAARLAGESLGTFAPAADTVGLDYVRQAGTASRVLEDVVGAVPWFVDYDGLTQVGARPTAAVDVEAYQVLDADPRENLVTVAVDDLRTVGIGSILSEGLEAPLTVYELEARVTVDASRVTAWGGGSAAGRGRLAGLFLALSAAASRGRLFGRYRYRVVNMAGARVELQAVAAAAGLPDVLPISQRPGVAGAHAKLTGGSIVLVEFIEGDRTMPIVSAFAGKDEEGDAPDELDFSVTSTLRLGSDSASEGVGLGDSLKSYLDAHTHAYVGGGTASAPALTSPPTTAPAGTPLDPAPSGSGKVKADG